MIYTWQNYFLKNNLKVNILIITINNFTSFKNKINLINRKINNITEAIPAKN